jgi:AraC-like DNA-binding protein
MMGEMKHTTGVSTDLAHILLKYMSKTGIDSVEVCKAVGIDSSVFRNRESRISVRVFELIWKEAIERTEDGNFGLHFGREIANSYLGGNILFTMMMNCPTVGDALEKFCRYHNLMEDAIQPRIKLEDDFAYLSWESFSPNFKIPRHFSEALLCAYTYLLRHITENKLTLVEARFGHSHPRDMSEHEKIFRAPLLFEQSKNELVIERISLNLPIFLANPEVLETLERFAQRLLDGLYPNNSWSERIILLLNKMLVRGEKIDIETIAKELAISTRNLQNRLKEEGMTYQKLLDQVRKEIALNYLKKPENTICDVAFLLGFSEQSAFNHAFKRWTGSTPRAYRKDAVDAPLNIKRNA